ncbi:MAG: hypothetical protein [Microviridae sp.]|nr:MAG: hypothetical protein [Microviridae sp.]
MKFVDVGKWVSFQKPTEFKWGSPGYGRYSVDVCSTGVSAVVRTEAHGDTLVAASEGLFSFTFGCVGDFALQFVGLHDGALTSVLLPWNVEHPIGWENDESFFQVDLKSPTAISPELEGVLRRMQQNALLREQALREEIARLRR